MEPRRWLIPPLVVVIIALTLTGCSRSESLSTDERARLNGLDAAGAVEAYFESGDQTIELYLSSPDLVSQASAPNSVPNLEREGGIDNLVVRSGQSSSRSIAGAEGFSDIRLFIVEYDSRRSSGTGEPPGSRGFFVYTGTEPGSGHVKVLSVGTGP